MPIPGVNNKLGYTIHVGYSSFPCVKQCRIAVNSVINCSFFLLYLLFFYISKQFYRFWKWRNNMMQLVPIKKTRHVTSSSCHHSTRHRPLNTYSRSFGTKPIYLAVFKILGPKHIGVVTLTFQGHVAVASSVTWPFDSQVAISYTGSIVIKPLSPAVFKIQGPHEYWGHDLDLSWSRDVIGHVIIRFPGGHFL